MAFRIAQTFGFENVEYTYDRVGDVLYLSFGPPVAAVAIQVEDWLALRISLQPPPLLAGMTIIGFKRIFEKIHRYIVEELPERVARLQTASLKLEYDDQTDTLIMRHEVREDVPSIFEELAPNLYLEKSLPSKDVLGVKIVNFTTCGPAALENLFGAMVDTIFEPQPHSENAHLITNAVIRHIDWDQLAAIGA